MEKLQYFVGKICTVITNQTSRSYTDVQHANTFSGYIEAIDGFGVWMRLLPEMNRKAFFPVPICGIVEEEVHKITPEQEKSIKEMYAQEESGLITLGSIKNKVAKFGAK